MTGAHEHVSTLTPGEDYGSEGGGDLRPDLAERLRSMGDQPIDPAMQSAHLTAMASVRIRNRGLAEKLKVAAALVAGFALGSTGLAFAGALPTPAQDAASDALARVGVSVPAGTERYFGAECVAAEDGSHARNRGQYLKQERAKGADALAAAKASDCGMPVSSLSDDGGADEPELEQDEAGVEETDESKADKAPKCVDGVKVTGQSAGKGRSKAGEKASKACETPDATGAPGAEVGESDDEAEDGSDEAEDESDERGKSADRRNDEGKGERGKPDDAGPPAHAGDADEDDDGED